MGCSFEALLLKQEFWKGFGGISARLRRFYRPFGGVLGLFLPLKTRRPQIFRGR
jgi:hypothetical protein